MSELTYEHDHAGRAVSELLLSQHRGRPRLEALVRALADGCQLLEDLLFELYVDGGLDGAEGAQLRRWGDLVGQPPWGLSDALYRRFIQARATVNRGRRNTDELVEVWRLVVQSDSVRHLNIFPACFVLDVLREGLMDDVHARAVARLMGDAKPAGISMVLVEAAVGFFGWEDDPDSLGFDDGVLARAL